MRIGLVILLFILIQPTAHASTQVIFSEDGERVTISLLGFPQNDDALNLYNDILAPPVDQMGKWTERIDVPQSNGAKSFDLSCVFSKVVSGTGSCILVLHAGPNLMMDPSSGRVEFELRGPGGAGLAALFTAPSAGREIFKSSEGHLSISSDEGFSLTYN